MKNIKINLMRVTQMKTEMLLDRIRNFPLLWQKKESWRFHFLIGLNERVISILTKIHKKRRLKAVLILLTNPTLKTVYTIKSSRKTNNAKLLAKILLKRVQNKTRESSSLNFQSKVLQITNHPNQPKNLEDSNSRLTKKKKTVEHLIHLVDTWDKIHQGNLLLKISLTLKFLLMLTMTHQALTN